MNPPISPASTLAVQSLFKVGPSHTGELSASCYYENSESTKGGLESTQTRFAGLNAKGFTELAKFSALTTTSGALATHENCFYYDIYDRILNVLT